MRVLRFNEYEKINEEEGWKTNVLIGLLSVLGVQAMGHKLPDTNQKMTTHTHVQNTAKSFIKQGWHLDSTEIDTVWNKVKVEKPETEVFVTRLQLDKNQYFESGKFTLSQMVKDSLTNTMNEISNNQGIITKIEITSSTDKQGLSVNLQQLLKNLGYTADNQGLSKARAAGIESFLKNMGVNDSLINIQTMFEQGSGTIDQAARFVTVDIYYLITTVVEHPGEKPTYKINKTYNLSKDVSTKHQHIRGSYKETKKLGPVKNFRSIKHLKCSRFN